ncbi:HU domain-containing protein [Mucilaginibacter pedocola]|uniref:CCDC81-like prokaryotic HU domain-containing protein n=1 Tax=Mucilaginibacter pedocola TaxID=1792845 RepID=A0A1S9PGQ4_9SPHI|nr:hypothetical protein [Mucilaginibacter pedocola]OOQ60146.1 hypothetical protein BC343_26870 [Mucilaginibacter pedocola]
MDVGYYISELLGLHGDVNVPGLGYFAHTRVNGYYSDREGKFYPPGYSVQFDPQFLDNDDALAVHIAEKKKISVASSKYFTEKYVLGLKQQAAADEAQLADLGWFTMHNMQLLFKPNGVATTDPEFYGYPTISLKKLGRAKTINQQYQPEPETYTPEPAYQQPAYQEAPYVAPEYPEYVDQEQEEYLIALTRKKRRRTLIIFVLLTLLVTAVAVFMIKKYDAKAFNFSFGANAEKEEPQAEAPKIVMETVDTTARDSGKVIRNLEPDSVTQSSPAVKDTASLPRYELIVKNVKTNDEAGAAILDFRKKGIQAHVVTDLPGKLIHISVGMYPTQGLAIEAQNQYIANKTFKAKDIYVQSVKPKG